MKTPVIAIIEDSAIITEIVSHLLETELGVRTVTFNSAEAAIREMNVYDPTIILLDYNLDSIAANNMDGMQFLKKLGLIGKSIPVIMMSGQPDKRVTADVLKAGVINYLPKHEEEFLENLITEVRRVLDVLKLNQKQKKQQKDINKRIIRIATLLLVPMAVILVCLYCQS